MDKKRNVLDQGGFWKPSLSSSFGHSSNNNNGGGDVLRDDEGGGGGGATAIRPFNFATTPLAMQRKCLPIVKHRTQLLYALEHYSVIVVVGETGSGKSTQIPHYLYENGWCDDGFSICCTQPRRIAAQTLAQRVSQEMGERQVGQTVGYTVRFDDCTSPQTAIRYMTDGMLLREASLFDPLLSRYSVIMIDEAHELNRNTEVLLGVLKKIRRKRKNSLRIIVCSATIDAKSFLDFFIPEKIRTDPSSLSAVMKDDAKGVPERKRRKRWGRVGTEDDNDKDEGEKGEDKNELQSKEKDIQNNGTIISIDGRQHPVDILHVDEPVADYVKETVETAIRIHVEKSHDNGDILCFLATGEEIDHAIRMAEDMLPSLTRQQQQQVAFMPLYGTLPYHVQSAVFRPKTGSDMRRRIIFASNIAETSVTVPHISFVVDSGFVKMPYFDTRTGFERLIICPISQASARQRAGRSGRIKPGQCYRLYTEKSMLNMATNTPPEIHRTGLSPFILILKSLGIHNILSFDMMNVPSVPALCQGLESLFALGAIDEQTNLTSLGEKMSEFPTEPRVSRMMLESLSMGCSREILKVAAALQVRALFYQPRTPKQQIDYDSVMGDIIDRKSDHVTFVNLMEMNELTPLNNEDCKERFVNRMALKRACEVNRQLSRFLRKYGRIAGMDNGQSDEEVSACVRKCLTAGFFSNVGKLGKDGRYYSLKGSHMISISTSSVLHRFGMGEEYIIFGETYDGSKGGIEVRCVSTVEGKWLRELAPHYFD